MNVLMPQSSHTMTAGSSKPRILVVDDEQHMCDICSRALRHDYTVVTTSDPDVAIALVSGIERFDLLLTDIKMPALSGLDLAQIAREHDPSIAIIIMTGFASMEHLHQSVQRGVAEFLSKPFELEQLRLAVDQALHRRSLLQDSLRLRALEQLLVTSEALSGTLELGQQAQILLERTLQQSQCRAGFVLLVEAETQLKLVAASASTGELLRAGYTLAEQAVAQRQNLVGSEQVICQLGQDRLSYGLVVVLRAQGAISGVLVLCDDRPTLLRPGVQEEIVLLANYAGAALRNASLYQQLGDAYQRLQELDRLKSEFISIASHELRTPLSIVLGYTMMLRDQGSGAHREYLQRVMENAQRIKDIVDDMVSLRHLETGETMMVLERCDLDVLIRQAIERMRPAAEDRQHALLGCISDEALLVQSDPEKLLLILGHLISNAIRFTPPGGRVQVSAHRQLVDELEPMVGQRVAALPGANAWIIVEVQDTGIGIPEREQPRIFERFYQVADSLTRDHGGTGLGLAIVRELVAVLGGVIWVSSRENQGSTFAFALPDRHEH